MAKDLLKGLTNEQKKAVTHTNGPCLLVSGAGTGKTTVITRRIARLVQERYASPEEILALTFTEKAANEMLTRVDELSDYVYSSLQISTFHSFGSELINEYAYELGLPADLRTLTDTEQVLFLRDNILNFDFNHYQNLADPTSLIRDLVSFFSKAKDENITPDEYIKQATSYKLQATTEAEKEEWEKQLELAKAYKKYNELLRSEGYIDYGDQINLVLELLEKPSIEKKLKARFKYVLIDEFQDTNYVQNKLIKEIFGENGNVMVVGDDDQSIYAFRGASVDNILNFKKEYKNVEVIVLKENFRSTQEILDSSYALIKNNNPERLEVKYKIDKKLISKLGNGNKPLLSLFDRESEEAEFIASEIIKNKKVKNFSDFAILVRANRHAEEFIRALKRKGIPYIFSGAAGVYEKLEAKILISLIFSLTCPEDDLSLFHLSASDIYEMNMDDLSKISTWSKKNNKSIYEAFGEIDILLLELKLSENTGEKAKKIVEDLKLLREESRTQTAGEILNLFLKKSGYYAKLTKEAKEGSIEAHNKITNIASFFDKIIHFQRNYKDHSLEKFSRYLEIVMDMGLDSASHEIEEGLNAVHILSMHKAKGLEFDTVFIPSLSDNHIPGRLFSRGFSIPSEISGKIKDDNNNFLREERRLFYVATTRAKKNLYLTASLDYGTKRTHKISRFVPEMLGEKSVENKFLKTEPIEKIKKFESVKNLYNISLEKIPESEKIVLSRAAIDDYLTCPFKYQLIHITPIRIVADSSVAYGSAVHNTISEYYKRKLAGKKVIKNEIFEWFDLFWEGTGFLSKQHKEKRYEHGIKALSEFYISVEKSDMPLFIEKEFKFNIENNIIKGRYDAIFENNGKIKIVDFKTSKINSKEEADDRTKKSSQLAVYALSWAKNNKQIPAEVELYFIENGIRGSFKPTEKSIKKTEEDILIACEGIRKRNFEATPELYTCKYCPFRSYCPVAVLERTS